VDMPAQCRLRESENTAGRYEGTLVAPATEGYYRLRATIEIEGEPRIDLEELIALEVIPVQ
jgi:hypothetical protein